MTRLRAPSCAPRCPELPARARADSRLQSPRWTGWRMRSETSIPHVLWRCLPRRSDEAAAESALLPNWETSRE